MEKITLWLPQDFKTMDDLKQYLDERLEYLEIERERSKQRMDNRNLDKSSRDHARYIYSLRAGMASEVQTIRSPLDIVAP